MQYFLLHPVLNSTLFDSNELLGKFMCLGDSFASVLELGAVKLKSVEQDEHESDLKKMVNSVEINSISRQHNSIIEKIVHRFGWDLVARHPEDERIVSMIACLLKSQRFDALEHIVLTKPAAVKDIDLLTV